MKLKLNINSHKLGFKNKFENCSINKLKRGMFLQLNFVTTNQKRRGNDNFRINKQTVMLLKKKHRLFSLSLIVSSLYKTEKVKYRYLASSTTFIKIKKLNLS